MRCRIADMSSLICLLCFSLGVDDFHFAANEIRKALHDRKHLPAFEHVVLRWASEAARQHAASVETRVYAGVCGRNVLHTVFCDSRSTTRVDAGLCDHSSGLLDLVRGVVHSGEFHNVCVRELLVV